MHFAAGFLKLPILLGAAQGLIMAILLYRSKTNRRANRLLSTLILLMALASANAYATIENVYDSSTLVHILSLIIPTVIVMPFGPLIYFYVRASINPDSIITKRERIHFFPVIIDLIPQLTTLFYLTGILSGFLKRNDPPWGNFIDTYNVYSDIPRWISITVYLWISVKCLSDHWAKSQNLMAGQVHQFKWLRQFIRIFLAFQLIWLLYLIPYVMPRYTDIILGSLGWYPIYLPITIMIYWLGIRGYLVSQLKTDSVKKPGNGGFILAPEKIEEAIQVLTKAMDEDKLYLNPNLNLHLVANHTGLGLKTISKVINQNLHKSFNDFVNEYRVKELQQKIEKAELNYLTIEGIAFECGFNSKATYQRAFKEFTGLSPSDFRRSTADIKS